MLGHCGIVAFDDSVDMAAQARYAMEFCALESLRQVHALPHRFGRAASRSSTACAPARRLDTAMLLRGLCDTMVQGSLCALGGMAPFRC